MTYALIVKGAVARYPYGLAELRRDNPQTSFPAEAGDWLAEWGVYPVAETARPANDPAKNIVEGTPALVGAAWAQTWTQVDASAEEVAARLRETTDATEAAEVKADGIVAQFLAMSPTQLTTYIANNSATLAALRTVVTKLAIIVLILAKRALR